MGGPFDADAEAHFDEVAEAFAKLTNVDRDVGVDLETVSVTPTLTRRPR